MAAMGNEDGSPFTVAIDIEDVIAMCRHTHTRTHTHTYICICLGHHVSRAALAKAAFLLPDSTSCVDLGEEVAAPKRAAGAHDITAKRRFQCSVC